MNDAIFLPMLATMALTAVVWVYMYSQRIPAMRRAGKSAQTYTVPGAVTQHLPEQVNYSANNFNNLLQVPVLYYILCLYLFVSGTVDTPYVALAWVFFVFRLLHSIEHCARNKVLMRFALYCGASLALWVMLGRALFGAIRVYL